MQHVAYGNTSAVMVIDLLDLYTVHSLQVTIKTNLLAELLSTEHRTESLSHQTGNTVGSAVLHG